MGVDVFEDLIKISNFPWLLSNVFDPDTLKPFIPVKTKQVVEIQGVKIGMFALAEKDWMKSLAAVPSDNVKYESFVEVAKTLTEELKTIDVNKICFYYLFDLFSLNYYSIKRK